MGWFLPSKLFGLHWNHFWFVPHWFIRCSRNGSVSLHTTLVWCDFLIQFWKWPKCFTLLKNFGIGFEIESGVVSEYSKKQKKISTVSFDSLDTDYNSNNISKPMVAVNFFDLKTNPTTSLWSIVETISTKNLISMVSNNDSIYTVSP